MTYNIGCSPGGTARDAWKGRSRMLGSWTRLVAASLAAFAPLALAAPASAGGASFSNQLLTSSFAGSGKVPHTFEPAIRVGPGDQVYVAANYHNAGTHE